MRKTSQAFRNTISKAIMIGSGVGMPQGILNPNSGIPICDVSRRMPREELLAYSHAQTFRRAASGISTTSAACSIAR